MSFLNKHLGSNEYQIGEMLLDINAESLDYLIEQTLPNNIKIKTQLNLVEKTLSEQELDKKIKELANKNQLFKNYIGYGYNPCFIPSVIKRCVLNNPAWYTAYTPYQAEISQGRLETLFNFQTLVASLTNMEVANASLLDEATAAAEAMSFARRVNKKNKSNNFFIASDIFLQTQDVVRTRANKFGFNLIVDEVENINKYDCFGALVAQIGITGKINSLDFLKELTQKNIISIVCADPMSLIEIEAPGTYGADVVVGSMQRFGTSMGYGGPHAGFFATHKKYIRSVAGRIIGKTIDEHNNKAYRMAMQTREQHIKRERANSNICTSQVLLANLNTFYAISHGKNGLVKIAKKINSLTKILAKNLLSENVELKNSSYFDTITIQTDLKNKNQIIQRAADKKINFNTFLGDNFLGITLNETTNLEDVQEILEVVLNKKITLLNEDFTFDSYANKKRKSKFLEQNIFNKFSSETQIMRYIKSLENKDFSLVHGMIPLGSCTMKLNASCQIDTLSLAGFCDLHPFCPKEQATGYQELLASLEDSLAKISGYDAVSLQPNSGAQGEYAGLLAIDNYHKENNNHHKNICLIPSSAHGTNPASAKMIGMEIQVVSCDKEGNISLNDLDKKIKDAKENLAAIMITYPSTHGVYEENISLICQKVHQAGGQVYLDGANMNAQVGLTNPGIIGADVSHLNLHKTFAIPHGGGGPGMGPIGVKAHLKPYLPGHFTQTNKANAVSSAPFGSASILPISYAYINLLGNFGLTKATKVAILNANYIAKKLEADFPILYKGKNARVAHECIIDIRDIKKQIGISETDIAKRLIDYGFHAPTVSFPVAGTLMIEPTESECKTEIDRFINAMKSIKQEIVQIQKGEYPKDNNPLVNAPHSQFEFLNETWDYPYSKKTAAACKTNAQMQQKFFVNIKRINEVYGDRNLEVIEK